MKGNIMDKKILLGGAAALLLVGNMYATPASAAIDLSIGGEASVTFSMSDECKTVPHANMTDVMTLAALNDANGLDGAHTDGAAATDLDTGDIATDIDIVGGDCGAVNEDNPKISYGKELSIGASGTLANGLSVSFSDTLDLTNVDAKEGNFELALGGAFGTLTIADGPDSAVKKAQVSGDANVDVTGTGFGGHNHGTSGTTGVGFLYQAPMTGGLDLYVSYAPNGDSSGKDDAQWQDTFGVGVTFTTDMLTIGAGWENASDGDDTACHSVTGGADFAAGATLLATADKYLGGAICGDETNMAISAAFDAGDISLVGGYSQLDSEEADRATYNVGASTTVGAYNVGVDYVNATSDYAVGDKSDTQTVLGLNASTSLGEGVGLSMQFSTNKYDVAGAASISNYYADMKLTVAF